MGSLRNVIEPGAIVVLFTLGALVNYRPNPRTRSRSTSPLLRPRSPLVPSTLPDPRYIRRLLPDNSIFEYNFTSRFLAAFPFLLEIFYWNLTYWIYQLARALTATQIVGSKSIWHAARSHAITILSFEQNHGFAVEKPIQEWTLHSAPWLMNLYATIYYSHIIVLVGFVVYTYTCFRRECFQIIRRTMAACNLLAFIILSSYRVMPPRMLPKRYGFVDILHPADGDSGSAWTHNRFQLTIAAMPSLHFGMAGFIAYSLVRFAPHRMLRIFAVLWPVAMLLTILATANHFLLDAMIGALIPIVAWRINGIFLVLRPAEEWLLRLARTMKPVTADQDPPAYKRAQKWLEDEERLE